MEGKTVTKKSTDFVFIGLALFAMFFGAGNLIFPPALGALSGAEWFIAFLAYFVADAGLAVLGVFAILKCKDTEGLTNVIGKIPGIILIAAVVICIGPGIAIPRTSIVSFGIGAKPVGEMLGFDFSGAVPLAVYSVVFFAVTLALTIRPSKVVDIVGKILTPALVVILLVLIAVGVASPQGSIGANVLPTGAFSYGILQGYQTLDVLASILFAGIIIASVFDKGYVGKQADRETGKSAVVAMVLLFIVYGGLAYLGASTGVNWLAGILDGSVGNDALVVNIVSSLLGNVGVILVAIAVILACLTTSIALVSSFANFFDKVTKGKLNYTKGVILCCLISVLLANVGLSKILEVSVPVLLIVCPVVVYLIVMGFLRNAIKNVNAYRLGTLVTLVVSIITVLCDVFAVTSLAWIHKIPLDQFGFNWLIPAIVATVVGMVIPGKQVDPIEE
ncbi:MAG: branched-chain amino acid transport system II carrier protein [Eubacteriales bacterium]|nr:branched-chain amino acid transport system II carrier protein [Eubacteriales bacterium]MDY3332716.1 branched-chain amino acid transport system II carrier protein [Gallibacter sp.]